MRLCTRACVNVCVAHCRTHWHSAVAVYPDEAERINGVYSDLGDPSLGNEIDVVDVFGFLRHPESFRRTSVTVSQCCCWVPIPQSCLWYMQWAKFATSSFSTYAAQLTFDAAYKRCKSKSELGPHQHKFNETYVVFRYSIHKRAAPAK